ncbi:MAG: DNA internalization-related competence protein ComEC/Rec2 [Syntrophobacteraceae bacterium CG07_land_8_20_14_0_80_61_8]|nr:MAG: DNA internalization-related competence protein ComEC/Rec2 [Syntrophobacteraceae bacterium CG07_land_8_20_14_0_80_61_8]
MPEVISRLEQRFRRRPLVWISLAFAGGLWLNGWAFAARPLPAAGLAGLPAAAAALLCWSCRLGRRPVPLALLLPVLFLGLGLVRGQTAAPELPYPASLAPFFARPGTVFAARIQAPPDFYPDKTRLQLALEYAEVDGRRIPVEGGVQLSIGQSSEDWTIGSRLLAPLTLKHFHNFGTPGAFDFEWFMGARGLYARAYVKTDGELTPLEAAAVGPFQRVSDAAAAAIDRRRQWLRQWLHQVLDPPAAALAEALFLGYRHGIEPPFRDALNRAGVTHLLAISGLHLGLVAVSLFWLGQTAAGWLLPRLLRRSSDRPAAWGVALAGALLYAVISGLALPTWRAALMLICLAAATLSYRRPDSLSFLAAAALLMLAADPNALWQVSFQLSFASFVGILLVYPRFQPLLERCQPVLGRWPPRLLEPMVSAFFLSLAVSLVILPIVAYHFHGVSVAGLLANAVLVPLVGLLVLPLGLLGMALAPALPWIAEPILRVDGRLLDLVRVLVGWFGDWSWSYLWIGLLPLWALIGCYGLLALLLARGPEHRRRRLALAAVVALALVSGVLGTARGRLATGSLEVDVIDIGQGSSTLLIFPQGRAVLVDGGGTWDNAFDMGRQVLAPFLWWRGIRRLDLVVLSHDHPDHGNGLCFILSQFTVGEYWETGYTERSDGTTATAKIAGRRRVPVRHLTDLPRAIELDGCTLRVLHPEPRQSDPAAPPGDLNNTSLVLAVRFGNTQVLIPGDIDQSIEKRLARGEAVSGEGLETLLIAAHHGSKRSSGTDWLDRLGPRAVLISCGFENGFGFPAEATLERFAARQIPVYRTDRSGSLYAVSDGSRWRFRTHREDSQQ